MGKKLLRKLRVKKTPTFQEVEKRPGDLGEI